jgi:type I restriction enzyme, S subunit
MSWQIKKLGDLADVITKGTTPTSIGFKYEEEGVNFIKVESITSDGKFLENKFAYISNDAHQALKRSQLKEGDILFSIAGALGRTALVNKNILPANTNQALAIIRLKSDKNILKEYILSTLTSGLALQQIENLKGGTAQQNLSLGQMKSFIIPIPPLSEQKQIVETLDKAFEKIDKAIANIEKNIQNAEELFQSKLEQIFSETDGSSDISWKYLTFDNLVSSTQIGIVRNTKEQSVDFPVRYFKMNNIKNNNGIDDSKYTSINATEDEIRKYSLKNGDFLFNTRNSYELVGKTCVFRSSDNEPIVFNNNILRARFKDFVNSDFVAYAFCTEKVKIKLNNIKNGTTSVVGIYYKSLKDLKIPVPPLSEQKKIVESLDNLNNHVQSIIMKYKKELINLEELKKSILEKAFKGELTSAV